MKEAIKFLKPYFKDKSKRYALLLTAMGMSLLATLAGIVPFMILYHYLSKGATNEFTGITVQYGVYILLSTAIIGFVTKSLSTIFSHKIAFEILTEIRKKVLDHISKVSIGFFNKKSTGELKKALTEDVSHIEVFLAHHLPDLFSAVFSIIIIILYMFYQNLILATLALIPLLLVPWLQRQMAKGANERMNRWVQVVTKMNSSIVEFIKAIAIVKVFDLKIDSSKRYSRVIDEYCEVWTDITKSQGPTFALFTVLTQSPIVIILPVGGLLYINGLLSGISYLLFCILSCVYLSSLKTLAFFSTDLSYLITGATKIDEILGVEKIENKTKGIVPNNYDISFNRVSFSYGDNEVLKDIDFTSKAGTTTALVGTSGSGKSTIAQLLLRFWDIEKGEIKIGRTNIKDISNEELMFLISYVSQDVFIQNGTVFENIKMGRRGATIEEVHQMAIKAQIHDFILKLPQGYDTVIGRNGHHLSGGEKQRISLARAFLKNSPILILDEVTSATDVENEAYIKQAIEELSRGKTVISIAHRLGIIKNADKIIYLKDGEIEISGTQEELIKDNKEFRKMWQDYERLNSLSLDKGGKQYV